MTDASKRVALILQGGNHCGRAIAAALADCDFELAICDTFESPVAAACFADLEQQQHVHLIRENPSTPVARTSIIDSVRKTCGRLDVLVSITRNTSATTADILESTEESFDSTMSQAVKGPFFLTQLAANWMIEQEQLDASFNGVIINVSSLTGDGLGTRGEYALVKPGITMSTQLWAHRLAAHRVSVFEIRTGIIDWEKSSTSLIGTVKPMDIGPPADSRLGRPDDVGRAVVMLARGELSYATGNSLNIDGGLSLRRL